MREGGGGDQVPMRPVGLPAMVFAPRHFVRVGLEPMPANPMVNAHLGATQAREVALGLIGARPVFALVLDRMIDALHRVAGVEDVPAARFVGVNFGSRGDVRADHRNRVGFLADNPRPRIAAPLAGDNHDLALDIERAAIWRDRPSGSPVSVPCRNRRRQPRPRPPAPPAERRAHRLAQLVQQHECRFRVDVHVARHMQRRDALERRCRTARSRRGSRGSPACGYGRSFQT